MDRSADSWDDEALLAVGPMSTSLGEASLRFGCMQQHGDVLAEGVGQAISQQTRGRFGRAKEEVRERVSKFIAICALHRPRAAWYVVPCLAAVRTRLGLRAWFPAAWDGAPCVSGGRHGVGLWDKYN